MGRYREEFLKDAIAFLVGQPPPLEKDQTDKEIALLEKMYSDLKIKQEQETNDLKEKLSKLKQQREDVKPSQLKSRILVRITCNMERNMVSKTQIGFFHFKA